MFSPQIEWHCTQCGSDPTDRRKYCTDCDSMLTWTCTDSGKTGLYTHYYRHRDKCNYCTPELEEERQKQMEEKQVAIQQRFQTLDDSQRPWSEWKRTDTSCIQHTGHDVEQCVYPAFVSLPADLANRRTPHGPQQDHKLIVDSTFIAIHEPHDSEQRKEYYHAKSPTNYAIKVQVACDFRHRIVTWLLEHVEESVQIIGDKAYIGEEYVVTLRKKLRGRELTQEDKDFNRDINSARAAIENINQRLKAYAILGSVYRGRLDDFHKVTKIIQVVAAL
ncbi:unnamed protein product [Rotaria sp. Silwood1]|nr:unnamed protein product [Rotaria sp. Silwood1]